MTGRWGVYLKGAAVRRDTPIAAPFDTREAARAWVPRGREDGWDSRAFDYEYEARLMPTWAWMNYDTGRWRPHR